MWRIEHHGAGGYRWASGWATTGDWTADELTTAYMREQVGRPVPYSPMGPVYQPTGPTDPVAVYLTARVLIPGPQQTSGVLPTIPLPKHPAVPPDVEY